MKRIFVATSYSSKVDYETGEVFPEYKEWLESQLTKLESMGYEVFCALRVDSYRINDEDPAAAYNLDTTEIKKSDILLALLTDHMSSGVQTEIGYALALEKEVVLVRGKEVNLSWFNKSIIKAGKAEEIISPITENHFKV